MHFPKLLRDTTLDDFMSSKNLAMLYKTCIKLAWIIIEAN